MSSHYSAGQYDHAFKPIKLRNYMLGTNPWPGKVTQLCSPIRCGSTQFIACDNGHLYPEVCRNPCSSPWGDYSHWIWEKEANCCCVDKVRHPHKYKQQKSIYIGNSLPNPRKFSKAAADDYNNEETDRKFFKNICEDDPCALTGKEKDIWAEWAGKAICGSKEAVEKQLRKQKYEEKVKLMQERKRAKARGQPKLMDPIVFRFSIDGISRCGALSGPKKKSRARR